MSNEKSNHCYFIPVPNPNNNSTILVGKEIGKDWVQEGKLKNFSKESKDISTHSSMTKLEKKREWWRYPVGLMNAIVVDVPVSIVGTILHVPLVATGIIHPDTPMKPEPNFNEIHSSINTSISD